MQVDGKACLFEILLEAVCARKELQRLQQEAKELSIKLVGDSIKKGQIRISG